MAMDRPFQSIIQPPDASSSRVTLHLGSCLHSLLSGVQSGKTHSDFRGPALAIFGGEDRKEAEQDNEFALLEKAGVKHAH